MKRYESLLMIAALAALTSCGVKNDPEQSAPEVRLSIDPTVMQAPETKQAIFGTPSGGDYLMPNGSSYGLFICKHHDGSYTDGSNQYIEYALNYNNIPAIRNLRSGIWTYTYFGYTDARELYLKGADDDPKDGNTDVSADIFAYAPYQQSVTRLESIPFNVTSAMDVMYAAENPDPNVNKDIDPGNPAYHETNPAKVYVPLTFTHALSLLEFCFTLKNPRTNQSHSEDDVQMGVNNSKGYTLDYIRIDAKDGGHPLHTSGTMNAMTGGTLSGLNQTSSVTVSGTNLGRHVTSGSVAVTATTNPSKAYVLQVPSQTGETYADGDYVISFKFTDQEFPVEFTLLRDHIMHSDGSTCGFQPGYRYTFNFVIDNYIHFEGVNVGEWETVTEPIIQKEI